MLHQLTGTRRYLVRIGLFLVLVAAIAVALSGVLKAAFLHNPGLNGVILGTLVLGVVFIVRQVLMLSPEIAWLENYQRNQSAAVSLPVKLLAPMAAMLGERRTRLSLSATATRSLLDSIGARLDEGRDISRYLIGLLVLLGLLGTFWGLIQTVGSVGDVVGKLSFGGGDAVAAFEDLKQGLATPLSAMGTAFSSSLFGLAGSLVLGFLDLQAGAAQSRFYNELEEWLASQTRIGGSGPSAEGEASVPAYIQALLEQTADSLDALQRTLARTEEGRQSTNAALTALVEHLAARPAEKPTGVDEVSRSHLRNLDLHLTQLLEDQRHGRGELIQEVRAEIRLLARTIAALAEEQER